MKLHKKDNRPTLIAIAIAAGIHILVLVFFWQSEEFQEMVDNILSTKVTQAEPPPPPPPPPPPKVQAMDPIKPDVVFNVNNPMGKMKTPGMELDWNLDLGGNVDWDALAIGDGLSSEDINVGVNLVTADVSSMLGMDDLSSDPRAARSRTKVIGKGRRMKGVIPATFLASDLNKQDQVKGKWNYLWTIEFTPFDAVGTYFAEETHLRLSNDVKNVDLSLNASMSELNRKAQKQEYDFDNDFYILIQEKMGKTVPDLIDKVKTEPELVAIERIRALSSKIAFKEQQPGMSHFEMLELIINDYHQKKYLLEEITIRKPKELKEKIETELRQDLRPWRSRSIDDLAEFIVAMENQDLRQEDLKPPYLYFKKAEALLNPILFAQPFYGIEIKDKDMRDVLATYLQNGGVLYLTDPTLFDEAKKRNRAFVRDLISEIAGPITMDSTAQKTYDKLSKYDRDIPGFRLIDTKRQFMHPKVPVEFEVPTRSQVNITAYNKHGQKVRQLLDRYVSPDAYTYNRKKSINWKATDDEQHDLASGVYFLQMQAGLFQKTRQRNISRLRLVKEDKHPLFSSYYILGAIPTADQQNYEVYQEDGVHAYEFRYKDRLTIFYSEGFAEMNGFGKTARTDNAEQRAFWARNSSRWMANFFAYVLAQENGVTMWPG